MRTKSKIPPKHIQAPTDSMNATQIPPDIPRYPTDTPQISHRNPRHLQGTRHANRRQETPTDTAGHTFSVWRCLVVSVGMSCSLERHWECLGDVWGGVWRYLSVTHGICRRLDVFGGYLGSPSLQYGAKAPFWQHPKRHDFLSLDHIETLRYQNGRI